MNDIDAGINQTSDNTISPSRLIPF